jgi:hypothetical protein
VKAREHDPDASTTGDAHTRRRGREASEGAAVGLSMGLTRIGEVTVGEAMLVDTGETGVGHSQVGRTTWTC